jgi:hypothetical protein
MLADPRIQGCHDAACRCDRAVQRRLKNLAASGVLIGIFPVTRILAPALLRDSLPLCPFRCITGKPCPFCGLTRAIALAGGAHWRQAFQMNPIWPIFAGLIVVMAILFFVDGIGDRYSAAAFSRAISSRWVWILGGLMIFDAWRIIFFNG